MAQALMGVPTSAGGGGGSNSGLKERGGLWGRRASLAPGSPLGRGPGSFSWNLNQTGDCLAGLMEPSTPTLQGLQLTLGMQQRP